MKILFMCGYHANAADATRHNEDYLDAYRFCRAVHTGEFDKSFYIHTKSDKVRIHRRNIGLARRAFGKFIAKRITEEASWTNPLLIPIPSEDALFDAKSFRSWVLFSEALASTELRLSLVDALLWVEPPPQQVQDANYSQSASITAVMTCDFPVRGQAVVLVDDLVSTGTTLLAARDRLRAEGAVVLGAITCGHVIHNFNAEPFGRQEIWLEDLIASADPTVNDAQGRLKARQSPPGS
jgi:phosphoribosylpyrophosphate synthetase